MAQISNIDLSIVKDTANADITVKYTIGWSAFDQATNLQYSTEARLVDDDTGTGADGDETNSPGDDLIAGTNPLLSQVVSSNGQASTLVTKTKTIPLSNLNADKNLPGNAKKDSEIRAVVTLKPRLPVDLEKEGPIEVVTF